jgi:hypothetical protein
MTLTERVEMMSKLYTTAAAALMLSACAHVSLPWHEKSAKPAAAVTAREVVADHPNMVVPMGGASSTIWREALKKPGTRIIVSTEARSLWLVRDTAILFKAPVAVGRSKRLVYKGKEYDFTTPVGKRKVTGKGTVPIWIPPSGITSRLRLKSRSSRSS